MTAAPTVPTDYASPTTPGPALKLHRMPLVWVAVAVPMGFVFFLFFLTPSL
jgi:hypothetical protein